MKRATLLFWTALVLVSLTVRPSLRARGLQGRRVSTRCTPCHVPPLPPSSCSTPLLRARHGHRRRSKAQNIRRRSHCSAPGKGSSAAAGRRCRTAAAQLPLPVDCCCANSWRPQLASSKAPQWGWEAQQRVCPMASMQPRHPCCRSLAAKRGTEYTDGLAPEVSCRPHVHAACTVFPALPSQ